LSSIQFVATDIDYYSAGRVTGAQLNMRGSGRSTRHTGIAMGGGGGFGGAAQVLKRQSHDTLKLLNSLICFEGDDRGCNLRGKKSLLRKGGTGECSTESQLRGLPGPTLGEKNLQGGRGGILT